MDGAFEKIAPKKITITSIQAFINSLSEIKGEIQPATTEIDAMTKRTLDLSDSFFDIDESAKIFGTSLANINSAKMDVVQQQMDELIKQGKQGTEEIKKLKSLFDDLGNMNVFEKLQSKVQAFAQIAGQIFGQITSIFSESMTNQEIALDNRYGKEKLLIENSRMTEEQKSEALKKLGEKEAKERKELMIKKAKMDKASALVSAAIAGALAVVVALGTLPPGAGIAMAAIVGSLAAAQIALIASRPIPAFAEGSLVFGETLALVGEGAGTSPSNPEVIAPLDKLMGFMQPQEADTDNRLVTEISGENLRLVLERTNKARRFTGR